MSYQQAPVQPKNGMGIAALTCGIIALVLCWIPMVNFASFILGALAVIFGAVGVSKAGKGLATNKGMSWTGVGLGGVGFFASIVVFAAFIAQVDKSIDQLEKDLQAQAPPPGAAAQEPTTQNTPKDTVKGDIPGSGTFVVGKDIQPGTYKTAGPESGVVPMCSWARLENTSGKFSAIITNGIVEGPTTVTIKPSDGAFKTSGCKAWTKR